MYVSKFKIRTLMQVVGEFIILSAVVLIFLHVRNYTFVPFLAKVENLE